MLPEVELTPLFRAVYDAPDADAPRLVLADALLEAGDPRGELISLQVAEARGTATEAMRARARELLARHAEAWLAGLRGLDPASIDFHRGFLRSCTYRPGGGAVDSEHWWTVEALRLVAGAAEARELGSASLARLERLTACDATALAAVLAGADKPRLRDLEVLGPWQGSLGVAPGHERVERERRQLLALTRFPALRTLRLAPEPHRSHADFLAWLWESPLARQLRSVHVRCELPVDIAGTARLLERARLADLEVRFWLDGLTFVLAGGALVLDFRQAQDLVRIAPRVRNHVRYFAPDPYARFSVRVGGLPASSSDLALLGDTARRFAQ